MQNNLNDNSFFGDINSNLRKTIEEVKQSLQSEATMAKESFTDPINNQKELIKEMINNDIIQIRNIKVQISNKIHSFHNKISIIGKATKNGIKTIEEHFLTSLYYKSVNSIDPWQGVVAYEKKKDKELEKEVVLKDDLKINKDVDYVAQDDKVINVNQFNSRTLDDKFFSEAPIVKDEVMEDISLTEEHPMNVIDAIKVIAETKKLSFEALKLSGRIKLEETKDWIINTAGHNTKNFICKINKDAKDKIRLATSLKEATADKLVTDKDDLQAKVNAYKARLEEMKNRKVEPVTPVEVVQPVVVNTNPVDIVIPEQSIITINEQVKTL